MYALSATNSMEAVAQLGRMSVKVKYPSARKILNKAFERAAEQRGLDSDDLAELAVPTFGLDQNFL